MTSCLLPSLRIGDPGELIDTLPYLLGFHPRESLVLVGFAGTAAASGPHQVQVTVRLDLPADPRDGLDGELLEPLADVLAQAGCRSVAAVLITGSMPGGRRMPEDLLGCRDALAVAMAELDIDVLDVLVATDRRWWSLCCEQPDCCPADGHPRSAHPAVAARAGWAGLVALPDRQALADTLAGWPPERRAVLLPLLAAAERDRAAVDPARLAARRADEITALLAAAEAMPVVPDEAQLAGHAVALTDLRVRDALWLAIDDGSRPAATLMAQLHARLPPPYDAAPLFLLGWSHWRSGNATLAGMAADRVLQSRPGYSAAELLAAAAQCGLDPREVPTLSGGRPR